MVRRRDIKKSDFVSVSDSETTDTFDFVRNGQNLKIAQSDLLTALGVTGTLQTLGEATAIPVLQVIASENYIRNIIGGAGINVAVSAQNGIEISHNFTVDATGVPVMIDSGADSPTIRSISAGSGISVAGAGGEIQISSTDIPESTKTVNVFTIDDFPTQVAGVITLENDTEYKIQNDVSSSYRYVMGSNTVLSGSDSELIELEYTGIGVMVTSSDVSFKIRDLFLSCSAATMFDVASTTNLHTFRMFYTKLLCDNVGNFDNMGLVDIENSEFKTIYTQGVTFSNNFGVIIFNTVGFTMPSGTGSAIVLGTATVTYLNISKCIFNVDTTGYIISGLANSGNILTGGLGLVTESRNLGTGADPPSDNIYPDDDRWESQHNSTLHDSHNSILATYGGGTITISAAGLANAVKVGATWTNQLSARFTATSDGIFTFTGNQANVSISVNAVAAPLTVADQIALVLYKNGVQIPASYVSSYVTANQPLTISLIWNDDVENGDYFEVYTANLDASVNVVITKAILRIF